MTKATQGQEGVIELINAIDTLVKKVHTQSLDLSFNELLDMYKSEDKELDINPDYQRLFQWSEGARSRFIESLLLEMPVPPIYVIEEKDSKYILIDGLQRISSYLHLRGELEALHLDPPVHRGEKLVLTDCDIVEELNGKTFDDLGTALQIKLKRAFIRVEIVRKGSDPQFKYHMFKRLNTGGMLLTPQQLRNCTIRLLDSKFNDFIIDLSKEDAYLNCTAYLSQDQRSGAYDQELVLRFLALKNYHDKFIHDVSDFLTEYMEAISDPSIALPFDYAKEKSVFLKTFSIFDSTLGDLAFSRANKTRERLTRGFFVYHFEAFTIGLQACLKKIKLEDAVMMERLKNTFEEIKYDEKFINMTTGGGKNSRGALQDRIQFVEHKLKEIV